VIRNRQKHFTARCVQMGSTERMAVWGAEGADRTSVLSVAEASESYRSPFACSGFIQGLGFGVKVEGFWLRI